MSKFEMKVLARLPGVVFVQAPLLGIEGRRVVVHAKFTEHSCEFGRLSHEAGNLVSYRDKVDMGTARWEPEGTKVHLDSVPEVKSYSVSFRDRAGLEDHIAVMQMAFYVKRLADSGELPTFVD